MIVIINFFKIIVVNMNLKKKSFPLAVNFCLQQNNRNFFLFILLNLTILKKHKKLNLSTIKKSKKWIILRSIFSLHQCYRSLHRIIACHLSHILQNFVNFIEVNSFTNLDSLEYLRIPYLNL